ncbi:hypothetical protein BLN97_21835 [Bradyrhizobium elkanii]|nr:hypothetical protein BLN97_21835 [Bradyrhizobium elkanii]
MIPHKFISPHTPASAARGKAGPFLSKDAQLVHARPAEPERPLDIQGEETPFPWLEDWRCLYDLKTGTFSVPASFAEHNRTALKAPDPARK